MDLLVLDSKYETIGAVDAYKSLIWTVRFNEVGDFELNLPATQENVDLLKEDRYLWRRDSNRLMIIDTITITTSADDGPMLMVTGESLETILKYRVIASYSRFTGNFQNAIRSILLNNVISPALSVRRIPNFTFKASTDPKITKLTIDTYFYGDNVYDAIEALCKEKKIGFRVLPSGEGGFEFELYSGTDRSYAQDENPWVVFSPKMENLLSSNYTKTLSFHKNSILSIGTYQREVPEYDENGSVVSTNYEETEVTTWAISTKTQPTGLARRETFLDNNDLTGGEKGGTLAQWQAVAIAKGREELNNYEITTVFDGDLNSNLQYVYGVDFELGDIVQVTNEFGMSATSYISELIYSIDESGEQLSPSFTSTEEETI